MPKRFLTGLSAKNFSQSTEKKQIGFCLVFPQTNPQVFQFQTLFNALDCPFCSKLQWFVFLWAMCNRITNLTCVGLVCSQVPFFLQFLLIVPQSLNFIQYSFWFGFYDWLIPEAFQAFHQFQQHSDSRKIWVGSEVRIPYLMLWWNGCAKLIKPIE